MKMCVEEGILQAFLDGELSPETSQAVAAHLTACAACCVRAREAEAELLLFVSVMSPAAVSVPTERLRARLDAAIAGTQQIDHAVDARQESRWRVWLHGIAVSLTLAPGRAAAFASLLVAAMLSVFFAANRLSPREIGRDEIAAIVVPAPASSLPSPSLMPTEIPTGRETLPDGERRPEQFLASSSSRPRAKSKAVTEPNGRARNAEAPVFLPGEKTYLTAIASLTTTIESGGPQSLPPTLRAEYERNLAVVNQAIISTRVAARRNPQDTDAHEFLRTAYQNKVELLSAVAEQSQLASVKD